MTTIAQTLPTDRMFVRKKWTMFTCSIVTLVETVACAIIMSNVILGSHYYYYYDNYVSIKTNQWFKIRFPDTP